MDTDTLREQIYKMVALQEVEKEALELKSVLESVENRIDVLNSELLSSKTVLETELTQTDNLKKTYRELESETKANQDMIVKCNEKLRAVKTNKEYQTVLKEIDELNKKNSQIEDSMLEHLDKIDAADRDLAEKKDDFTDYENEIEDKKSEINKDAEQKKKQLGDVAAKGELLRNELLPEFQQKLDYVKGIAGIEAVAPVMNSVCHGCHMNIPPQLYNELQRFDKIYFCPNCQRIIYWKDA